MKNVVTRSITGLIYIGLIVGAIFAGGYWMLWLAMLLTFLAISEFNGITNRKTIHSILRGLDMLTAGMALLIPYSISELAGSNNSATAVIVLCVPVLLLIRMVAALYVHTENALKEMAFSFMAQIYITLPMVLLLCTYYFFSPQVVLLMFVMIWLNDTGAFCVGSLIGKNKLFERISPKKSWEGFFGGVAFAIIAGVVAGAVWTSSFVPYTTASLGLLGLVVAVFATWGDLTESLIKRTLGIKDSGTILPGHGGILDRIDSLLFVSPITFVYLTAVLLF